MKSSQLAALCATIVLSVPVARAQYCSAPNTGFNCGSDEYISRVQLASIDRSSACVAPPGYEDYTSTSTSLVPGVPSPMTVTVSRYLPGDQVTAFCDWNADGDFLDSNETIPLSLTAGGGTTRTFVANVTPPAGSAASVRMRVRLVFDGCCPGGPPSACGSAGFGNTEDYTLAVVTAPTLQVAGAASPSAVVIANNVLLTAAVTATAPPNPPTAVSVHANLAAVGGSANATFFDDGTHGDAVAGDRTFSLAYVLPPGVQAAPYNLPLTATDSSNRTATGLIALLVQLPNDECFGAIQLAEGLNPASGLYTNVGATLSNSPTFATACGALGNLGGSDVFFFWIAGCTGEATVSTCPTVAAGGTMTDSQITVYDSPTCPSAGDIVGCADDSGCGPQGFLTDVTFPTIAGHAYFIRVAGYNGQQGTFKLSVVRHTALVFTVGFGCSYGGLPGPSLSGTPPVLGSIGTLSVSGAVPSTAGLLLVSAIPPGPTELVGGCQGYLWVLGLDILTAFTTNASGGWSLTGPLPSDPAVECVTFRLQAILVPASQNPIYQVTNGLDLELGV